MVMGVNAEIVPVVIFTVRQIPVLCIFLLVSLFLPPLVVLVFRCVEVFSYVRNNKLMYDVSLKFLMFFEHITNYLII